MIGFFVVWNPDAGLPRVRHSFEHKAIAEAERLAAANPGQKFYVLAATHASEHRTVTTTRLEFEPPF